MWEVARHCGIGAWLPGCGSFGQNVAFPEVFPSLNLAPTANKPSLGHQTQSDCLETAPTQPEVRYFVGLHLPASIVHCLILQAVVQLPSPTVVLSH